MLNTRDHPLKSTGSITSGIQNPALADMISDAASKTQACFLYQQSEDGYWWFELESNVTMTSEYLMLHHFLGIRDSERDRKMANYILKHQRPDGTWAIHWDGKGDLSTTIEAYYALKMSGVPADDTRMKRAAEFIRSNGGIDSSRVFTRIYLALFGSYNWEMIPSMPVEMVLLPDRFPLSIYNLSSWARTTIVPLLVTLTLRPVRSLPEYAHVSELETSGTKKITTGLRQGSFISWDTLLIYTDRFFKASDRILPRPFKKRALKKAETWILEHQEQTGDWAGIQPAMVNSVIALSALGYSTEDEPMKKGLEALERFTTETGDELFLQPCISPVWDTALTSLALSYSGLKKEHPALVKSCRWLTDKQIFKKGDWSIKRPELEPGGWAFEFINNLYPDIDDTAVVLMFLSNYQEMLHPDCMKKGLNWILGMQGRDGGWASFDVDNNMEFFNKIPLGDLEAMTDPSTPDITGRVLELLGKVKTGFDDDAVIRAISFLKKKQEYDGCWHGRWGVNYIYGTWSVLMGLKSIGEVMKQSYIRKAVEWLKSCQNPDGGWGECCESYEDPGLRGTGRSTASQTSWAVMSLIAVDEGTCSEARKGIQYLLETRKPDGTWEEKEFTGTGFPKYFMLRYHNYRNCFPLMALGMFSGQSGQIMTA